MFTSKRNKQDKTWLVAASLAGLWSLALVSSAPTTVKTWVRDDADATTVNCSALSPPPDIPFWDAMDRCFDCAAEPACGFCRSTLTCVPGNLHGPYARYQIWCNDWIPEAEACPVNPQCDTITDCGSCAASDECVWCASDASCMAVEEGYGSGCKALVSDAPCPTVIVPGTVLLRDVLSPRKLQLMGLLLLLMPSRNDHCRGCHHPPGAAERSQGDGH
jgi:hypothetical protein